MEWVLLASALIFFAGCVIDHATTQKRCQLIESLDRHTAEVKRQNEMLAKADRIVVASVRGSEERNRASFN